MSNRHDSQHPGPDDVRLRRLLSDVVSDVEPGDRLEQIRSSVRSDQKVVPMSRTRPWLYATTGVVATAAVIGVIAYATGAVPGGNNSDSPGVANQGTTSPGPVHPSTPTSDATTAPPVTPTAGTQAYAVYYVGDDPSGKPVLFREFHRGVTATPADVQALQDLESLPLDPDYRTPWHAGDLVSATLNSGAGVIDVAIGSSAVHDRPNGMSPAYAQAAIQQVIYTVQAAFHQRLPVQFTLNGNSIDQVLGVPTSEPLAQGKVLDTLSLMSISDPNQEARVSGSLTVTGVNNGFEASLSVYLEGGGKKYDVTPGMATGWGPGRLYPWSVTLDLTSVPPGQYTLVAQNDDPSGQGRAATDTRVIEVK
jgi:hypothetical protein